MSTLGTFLRHERKTLLADASLVVALLVFAACSAYALMTGAQWVKARNADIALAQRVSDERLAGYRADLEMIEEGRGDGLDKGGWYPAWIKSARSLEARPGLPSLPLAALSTSAASLQPALATIKVTSSRYSLLNDAQASTQNPATLVVGRFDAVFLLSAVLPLLLLAFSYNLVSAELENGTLAQIMVQPVKLSQMVVGKLLVRGALVLLPAVLLLLGGLFVLVGVPRDAQSWMDHGVLALMVVTYGVFWLALAALVNAKGRSSASNALTLGGLWLALVLVIPSLLNIVSLTFYPPPDRATLTNLLRSTVVEAKNNGENLVGDFNLQHADQPVHDDGSGDDLDSPRATLTTWLVSQRTDELVAPVADQFEQQLATQQELVERLRFLSPSVSFEAALLRLAGSDRARTDSFRDATRRHQEALKRLVAPRIETGQPLSSADYRRLPQFTLPRIDQTAVLLLDWLGILVPALVLGLLAARGFSRNRPGT
jgi:ABC-2 type transport system permease protein